MHPFFREKPTAVFETASEDGAFESIAVAINYL